MQVTIMSILSIVFYCILFSIVLAVILENITLLRKIKCEVILVCMAVIILKMFVPMEIIPWTINVNVKDVLPEVTNYLCKKCIPIGDGLYSRWDIIVYVMILLGALNVLRILVIYFLKVYWTNKLPNYEEQNLQNIVDKIVKEYGKDVHIPVKAYSKATCASVIGIKKVAIQVPLEGLEVETAEGMLRHEVAHYMNGDTIISLIWELVKAFFFWNVVIYILDKQLTKIVEIRADEKAIQNMTNDEVVAYGKVLIKLATIEEESHKGIFNLFLTGRDDWLIRKRIHLLSKPYQRTKRDLIINYVCMVIAVTVMLFVMNVFIFEPKGDAPEDEYLRTKEVTEDSYFLVKNAEGTYDMYMDGIYCATIDSDQGSRMKVYDSLEEALQHEEIE